MNLEVGESLPSQDLAFPSRWISQENWCLLGPVKAHVGIITTENCPCSLKGCGTSVAGGGGVFRAGC